MKKTLVLSTLLIGAAALTGCGLQTNNEILSGEDTLVQNPDTTQIANPASEYCVSQGGRKRRMELLQRI